jgi:flagellar basal-body rod protein FlgC
MSDAVRNFAGMRISASGLSAQRLRMDVYAENIANATTTRTEEGGPYRRKDPILAAEPGRDLSHFESLLETELGLVRSHRRHLLPTADPESPGPVPGVRVAAILEDKSEGPTIYDPTHPDADENGYVRLPNVEMIRELLNLTGAARAYEANLAAMKAAQDAAREVLRISG